MKQSKPNLSFLILFAVFPLILSFLRVPQPVEKKEQVHLTAMKTLDHTQPLNVKHLVLFDASNPPENTGTYNHHAVIASIEGRVYTAWSNHRNVEDGPGMRPLVRVWGGKDWAPAVDVFGYIGETRGEYEPGDLVQPLAFVPVGNDVYLVSTYCRMVGLPDRSKPLRVGMGRFAVLIDPQGKPASDPFWLEKKSLAYNNTAMQVGEPRRESSVIKRHLALPANAPAWEFADWTTRAEAADGTRLCEPTTYRALNGFVRLWRSTGEPIIYAQRSSDGHEWTPALPTNIPDAPSKTCSVNLPNGGVVIVGNFAGSTREGDRGPLIAANSVDGLTFRVVGSIRSDEQGPQFRTNNDRKCTGAQYPAAVIHEDALWVIYSVSKENIEVTRIPLSTFEAP